MRVPSAASRTSGTSQDSRFDGGKELRIASSYFARTSGRSAQCPVPSEISYVTRRPAARSAATSRSEWAALFTARSAVEWKMK